MRTFFNVILRASKHILFIVKLFFFVLKSHKVDNGQRWSSCGAISQKRTSAKTRDVWLCVSKKTTAFNVWNTVCMRGERFTRSRINVLYCIFLNKYHIRLFSLIGGSRKICLKMYEITNPRFDFCIVSFSFFFYNDYSTDRPRPIKVLFFFPLFFTKRNIVAKTSYTRAAVTPYHTHYP